MECLPEDMESRRLEGLAKFAMDHPNHPMVPLLLQQVRRAGFGEPPREAEVEIEGEPRESAWDYWIRDCQEQRAARKARRDSINLKRGINRWDTASSLELLEAMRRFEETLAELGVRGIRVTPESRWTTVAKNVPNRYGIPAAKFTRSCKVHFTNLLRMYKVPRRNLKGEDALDLRVRQALEELFQLSDENFPHLLRRRKGYGGNENGNRGENANIPKKAATIPVEKEDSSMPQRVFCGGSLPQVMKPSARPQDNDSGDNPDHEINRNTNGGEKVRVVNLGAGAREANNDPSEHELPNSHPQDQRADNNAIGNTTRSPPNDPVELDSDAESEMRWEAYRKSIKKQSREEDGEPWAEITKNVPATGDLHQGDLKGKPICKTYADMLCNSDSESKGGETLKSILPTCKDSNQAVDARVHLGADDRGMQLGVSRGGPSLQRTLRDPGEEKKKQKKDFERELKDPFDEEKKPKKGFDFERELRDPFDGEKKQKKGFERKLRDTFDVEKKPKKGFERKLRDTFDVEKKPKKGFERKLRDPFNVEKKPKKGFERKLRDPFDGEKKQKKGFERELRDPFDGEKKQKKDIERKLRDPFDREKKRKKPPAMDSTVALRKWDTASTLELLAAMGAVGATAENRWEAIASLVSNDGNLDRIVHINSCREQYRGLLSIYKRESCRANSGHKLLPDEVYAELDKLVKLSPTAKAHNVLNQILRVGKITAAPTRRVAVTPVFKTGFLAKKKDVQERMGISTSPELNKSNRGAAQENPDKLSFPDNHTIGNTNRSPRNDPVEPLDSATESEMRWEASRKSIKKRSRDEEEEPHAEITRNVPATGETGELRQGDLMGKGICKTDADMLYDSSIEPEGREAVESALPIFKDSNLAMDIDKASCKDGRVHLASKDRGRQLEVSRGGPSLQRPCRDPGVEEKKQNKDFERKLKDPGAEERKHKNPPTMNSKFTSRKWDTASNLELLAAMATVGGGAKADNRWEGIASLVPNDGKLDPTVHLNSCREQYRVMLSIYRRESCRANSGHKLLPDEVYAELGKVVHMSPNSKDHNLKNPGILRAVKISKTPTRVTVKPVGIQKRFSDVESRKTGKQQMGVQGGAKGRGLSNRVTQRVVEALIDLGNSGRGPDHTKDNHSRRFSEGSRDFEADYGGVGGKHPHRVEARASNSNEGQQKNKSPLKALDSGED